MWSSFPNLVANENMKIYFRVRTWIMLAILVFFSAAMPAMLYVTGAAMDAWTVFTWTESFTLYLSAIFTVVIAADIVAGEFAAGTIKLLLIRPLRRGKILMSKWVAVLLFILLCAVLTAVVGIALSQLFFAGTGGLGTGSGASSMVNSLLLLLTDTIQLVMIALVAFMLSTLFRSGSLAIGISLLVLFTKDLFGFMLNPDKYVWAKYILFLHIDLSGYIQSPIGPGGVSLSFSIFILAAYSLVFLLITWWAFAKRDVAA